MLNTKSPEKGEQNNKSFFRLYEVEERVIISLALDLMLICRVANLTMIPRIASPRYH